MNTLLQDYKENKDLIISAFDSLIKEGFVPCTIDNRKIEAKDINEQKDLLLKESFIISVCGQIKAGKSTFLNYLLFNGEETLPTDETPWTAKLTKIKYGEKKKANIIFYSKEQWKELKESRVFDEIQKEYVNYFDKYLKDELNNCAKHGIYEREVILEVPLERIIEDLSTLTEYVSAKGKYTPFVSYVEIIIDNPFIKDVIVVDTPGLNDPNIYRSQVTKKWIDKSNAIIYLLHVEEPLGSCDTNFIDKYLSVVPSDKIVFALSKIDNEISYKNARNYVETQLKNSKEFKQRNFLQNGEVYPISSMAAIIKAKKDNNKELSEDEKYYCQKTAAEILDNHGYMENFILGIEKHLMEDKGNAIIKTAKTKVTFYGQAKIEDLKYLSRQLEEKLTNIMLGKNDIDLKLKNIKDTRDKLKSVEYTYRNDKSITWEIDNSLAQRVTTLEAEIKEEFGTWINSQTFDQATSLTSYQLNIILKSKLQKSFGELVETKAKTKLNDLQEDIKNQIKEITKNTLNTRWDYVFNPIISFAEILDKINEGFSVLKESELNKLRDRIWYIKTDQGKSKARIISTVGEAINNFVQKELRERTKTTINEEVKAFISKIFSNTGKILNDLDKHLKDIKESVKDKEKEVETVNKEKEKLSSELRNIEGKYNAIKNSIGI